MSTPRVSILIPNYNNGRASSASGTLDLIGDLLRSLWDTLRDDPTPFELFAHDDGSTDDSIDTLRAWAAKTWPDGTPFLTVVESPHEGFIARANNRVFRQARGDVLVRLDGDVVVHTRHWVSKLCATLDAGPPDLGILAPVQLVPGGTVHAFGDMLLHPKGYHHVAQGAPRGSLTRAREVDHAMGCFYVCRRVVFDSIGGYDEQCLRGETEDFTVAARLKGWRCWATPDVEFTHRHFDRKRRASQYDDERRIQDDLAYFERKWGFSRLAPDLDAVRARYAGTPLLWNAEVFGPRAEAWGASAKVEDSAWARFASCARTQATTKTQAEVARQACAADRPAGDVAVVGYGDGVALHLLAQDGLPCVGVEWDAAHAQLGKTFTRGQSYTRGEPRFATGPADRRTLPLDDAACSVVVLWQQLCGHPNPVALLRDARRVLAPGGLLVIVEPRADGRDAAHYHEHELRVQLTGMRGWELGGGGDARGPICLTARKPRPLIEIRPIAA